MVTDSRRVLVTGLSGFVGQHILRLETVLASEYGATIIPDEPLFELCDRQSVERRVNDAAPDWVIHLAAQSNVPQAFANPEETLRINVLGTLHLLQALDAYQFKGRLLYVSSGDIYGATPEANLPIRETQLPKPGNPYAVSKLAAEALCLQWGLSASYDIVVARPFNHIGPGQRPDFVVPSIAKQIAESTFDSGAETNVMVGDIDVTRDFLDVRDVIHAYFTLLSKGKSCTLYNVCSGQERKIRDLALNLAELSGKTVQLVQDSARLRKADQRRVCGDNTRITQDTGWQPRFPLNQTLSDILQSYSISS